MACVRFVVIMNRDQRWKKSGVEIEVLISPIDITIHTKVPTKYVLLDEETGQIYRGNNNGTWTRIDNDGYI
jgi:hypothetical protein